MHWFLTLTYICCDSHDIHQPDGKMITEMAGQRIWVTIIIYLPKSPDELWWQEDMMTLATHFLFFDNPHAIGNYLYSECLFHIPRNEFYF